MSANSGRTRTFRAWPEVEGELVKAEELNMNVSEIINEALKLSARKVMKAKAERLREALLAHTS